MNKTKKTILQLAIIALVCGIALAIYFSTALERDYLYEILNGFDPEDGQAYVYKKGTTMYVTSHPSFLKKSISDLYFSQWGESITRVVIVDEIAPECMDAWFAKMTNLRQIDGLEKLDVSRVTRMSCVFNTCSKLEVLNGIEQWDTSSVTDMSCMFSSCQSLHTLDLSNWDVSNVESMSCMFTASGLVEIKGLENWNVEKLDSAVNMFMNCRKLETIGDLNSWSVPDDCHAYGVFSGCDSLRDPEPYWAS